MTNMKRSNMKIIIPKRTSLGREIETNQVRRGKSKHDNSEKVQTGNVSSEIEETKNSSEKETSEQ